MKRPAYTLLELTVSVGVASLLILGMSSALIVASKAVETPSASKDTQDSGDLVREFLEDAQHAIYILEHTDKAFEFALADMDGDSQPDVVRYEWSGVAGDPLFRTFNGGSQITVAESVQNLQLDYYYRTKTEQVPEPPTQSAEELLTSVTGGSDPMDDDVQQSKSWGQYFKPTFPNGVTVESWDITKVYLQLAKEGLVLGHSDVEIYVAAGSVPTSTPLATQQATELLLASAISWEDFATIATDLDPNAAYCLVVKRGDMLSSKPAQIRHQKSGVNIADHWMLFSGDEGATWETHTDQALHFKVYGKYWYDAGVTNPVNRRYLTGVRASLQLGAAISTNVVASVPLLNTPETVKNVWQLDFDQDPTLVDVNFDLAGDWSNGGTFDNATLVNGVWKADANALETRPLESASQPITANVRMRAVSTGGDGAVFVMHYDQGATTMSTLAVKVALQGDGTQTATLSRKDTNTTWEILTTVSGLPAGFVDVRIVAIPALDHANLKVNGVDQGSFATPTIWEPTINKFFSVSESGADAEFDYVSVRVSDPN